MTWKNAHGMSSGKSRIYSMMPIVFAYLLKEKKVGKLREKTGRKHQDVSTGVLI
jgi:hypothetical protein